MLNKDVVLADGLLALLLLIGLQYLITKLSSRFSIVKNIITSSPTVLLYRGKVDHKALKKQRLTVDELKEAIRKKGIQDVSKVGAVILETAEELTVFSEFDKNAQNVLHDKSF